MGGRCAQCWWEGIGGLTRSGIDSGGRWGRQGHCARLAKSAPSVRVGRCDGGSKVENAFKFRRALVPRGFGVDDIAWR